MVHSAALSTSFAQKLKRLQGVVAPSDTSFSEMQGVRGNGRKAAQKLFGPLESFRRRSWAHGKSRDPLVDNPQGNKRPFRGGPFRQVPTQGTHGQGMMIPTVPIKTLAAKGRSPNQMPMGLLQCYRQLVPAMGSGTRGLRQISGKESASDSQRPPNAFFSGTIGADQGVSPRLRRPFTPPFASLKADFWTHMAPLAGQEPDFTRCWNFTAWIRSRAKYPPFEKGGKGGFLEQVDTFTKSP